MWLNAVLHSRFRSLRTGSHLQVNLEEQPAVTALHGHHTSLTEAQQAGFSQPLGRDSNLYSDLHKGIYLFFYLREGLLCWEEGRRQEQGAAPSPRGRARGRQQAGRSVSGEGVPGGHGEQEALSSPGEGGGEGKSSEGRGQTQWLTVIHEARVGSI